MIGGAGQDSEYRKRKPLRQPAPGPDQQPDPGAVEAYPHGASAGFCTLSRLLPNASAGGSLNASLRQEALKRVQRTHGNRAAQRSVQRSPAPTQQAGGEAEQDDGWPRWLSTIASQVRAMAGMAGSASGGAGDSAPAPVYGPLAPTPPTFATEPPLYGPIPPPGMAPPSLPARGELGHVAPYSVPAREAQPEAGYLMDDQGNYVLNDKGNRIRTTENEHVIPRGNMEQLTMNPNTGAPDYQDRHYARDATVRFDRETALDKTIPSRGGPTADNARTDALKARLSNNQPIDYRADVFEPSIENAKRARDATGASAITDEAIHRGALSQDANLFAMQSTAESGDIVRGLGSQVEDFDIVPYNGPESSPAPVAGPEVGTAPGVEAPHAVEGGGAGGWGHAFRPGGAVDRTLRGSNYALQFLGGLSQGQDAGEAASGALFGGFAGNSMGDYLSATSPKGGAIDMGINLLNTGLQAVGAPEEVTTVTQTAADATPSSFATSLASNAGRGLWNTGKGIFKGDWSGLKKQGEDLTHGKGGAPLQGYAVTVEAAHALLSGDQDAINRIADENRSGKRGKLAQWGSYLGGAARDATDWAEDKWDSWMGRGTRAQRENAKERAFEVHLDHLREERKEREEKAAFEKEMADIHERIEKGPAVPGTMLGTASDPLSSQAILARVSQAGPVEDEEEEALPHVSMALPSR